jgi:hypothetical protein
VGLGFVLGVGENRRGDAPPTVTHVGGIGAAGRDFAARRGYQFHIPLAATRRRNISAPCSVKSHPKATQLKTTVVQNIN